MAAFFARTICAFIALLLATAVSADKTDIVEFGASRMVGEVKGMERGKLRLKTDATDTIDIDWAEVTALVTGQYLRIETRDGKFFYASLQPGAANKHLALAGAGIQEIHMDDVAALEPIKATFWERLSIDTSLGYSYAKSNDVTQLNINANYSYDAEVRSRNLSLSSQRSGSAGNDESLRRTLNYQTIRLSEARWFRGWRGDYEDNDELSLDYRVLGAWVVGRELYPRVDRRIRLFTGPALTFERYADAGSDKGAEVVLGTALDWFQFTLPELDLSTQLVLFPSLSDRRRVRGKFNIALRWEIV